MVTRNIIGPNLKEVWVNGKLNSLKTLRNHVDAL